MSSSKVSYGSTMDRTTEERRQQQNQQQEGQQQQQHNGHPEEEDGIDPSDQFKSFKNASSPTSAAMSDPESGASYHNAPFSSSTSRSKSTEWNAELVQLVVLAATTAATLGYDVGSMAGAIGPMDAEFNMTSWEKELAMGSLNFIAALGALLGGPWADKYGRKTTVGTTCKLFLFGSILMAAAPTYWILLAGRIIAGLGVGVAFVAAPCYISEVAPPDQRGQLNTTFDIAINAGILMGYVVCYVVQILLPNAGYSWRIMLGIGALLPSTVLWLLHGLPESPRWLVLAKQQPAAKAVLQRLGSNIEESEEAVAAMEHEIKSFEQFQASEREHNRSLITLSQGKILAIGLGFWQQISGTEAVLYYSADYLARAGMESPSMRLLGNVAVGCCKLIPELVAMRIVDTVGRRPLLIASAFMLTLTIGLMGTAFYLHWPAIVVVILLCSIMASFSIGVGPFTFLCASENLSLSERAEGVTLCAAANRCTSGLVALTAVSLSEWLGDAGLFFTYAGAAFFAFIFYAVIVPETSGASLEELSAARSHIRASNSGDGNGNNKNSTEMEFRHLNPVT